MTGVVVASVIGSVGFEPAERSKIEASIERIVSRATDDEAAQHKKELAANREFIRGFGARA